MVTIPRGSPVPGCGFTSAKAVERSSAIAAGPPLAAASSVPAVRQTRRNLESAMGNAVGPRTGVQSLNSEVKKYLERSAKWR